MQERASEDVITKIPEDMPEMMSEDTATISEDMPVRMFEGMPGRMPGCQNLCQFRMVKDPPARVPGHIPEKMFEDTPNRMPEFMTNRLLQDVPDRMPKGMALRLPEDMPVGNSGDMPDKMSEYMKDRLEESRRPCRIAKDAM